MTEPAGSPAAGPVPTAAAYALVLLLTVLLAVWGAFLVPFRVGATLVPVSCVVALVGNLVLGRAGAALLGRWGVAGQGALWLAVALVLSSRRAEGDLVVPGTTVGLVFLLLGVVASSIAFGMTAPAGREPASAAR